MNLLEEKLMLKLIYLIMQQKKVPGIDTSKLAAKSDLASLKAQVDKIDVGNLETVPTDLHKLSNVVKIKLSKNSV